MLGMALCSTSPLAEGGKTLVEYVWIGAGSQLCSRTRVLDEHPRGLDDVPVISVDGSTCGLAPEGGEIFLKPRKLFNDPFRGGAHLLCLCDTFTVEQFQAQPFTSQVPVLQPHPTNNRVPCEDMMSRCRSSDATFTAEQEFAVLPASPPTPAFAPGSPVYAADSSMMRHPSDASTRLTLPFPFGSGLAGSPPHESAMHQAQQQRAVSGRNVAEKHLQCCLRAGIKMAEVSQRSAPPAPHRPGSHPVWSYQVGPLPGVELADQLWMSRFLLLRVSEDENAPISFDPAAHGGLRRGLKCTFDYSTAATRRPGAGLGVIQQHMELLRAAHLQHTLAYGGGNPQSLAACQFSVGVGNSHDSIVIPSVTVMQQAGQFRDCRPWSNSDPYMVATMLASTTQQVPLQLTAHRHVLQAQSVKQHTCVSPNKHACCPALSQVSQPSVCDEEECDDDDDLASMNSEEVLIDELDRMDGLGPDTPPQYYGGLGCMLLEEGYDECCSDGSSPELPFRFT